MMESQFSANEVFEIAKRIENNGGRFYRLAAEKFDDKATHGLLMSLANMESEHEKVFAAMADIMTAEERIAQEHEVDPNALAYLHALADSYMFSEEQGAEDLIHGLETIEEILKKAIALEKDSIVLYLGLKDAVPENLGKGRIEDIIREEMQHITTLTRHLAVYQGKAQ
jgi:rubrerythrin